jgi:hypothetical protein
MPTIRQITQAWQSADFDQVVRDSIVQTSYEITALNKTQLYNYGVGSDGVKLTPYKSPYYAKEKNNNNPRPGLGQPDLFVTGAFYNGIAVVVTDKTYITDSTDEKAPRLELLYGSKIYGLTDQNKSIYATETLLPVLVENIKTAVAI